MRLQAHPCPKPHPRCVLACQGRLVFVRTYKKARFSLAGRTYNSEFLWIIMVLSELFLVAK